MSDGNITHHTSAVKNNSLLGGGQAPVSASPERHRTRTTSTSSTSTNNSPPPLPPVRSLIKRPFSSSEDEHDENTTPSNITDNFANLEFRSVQTARTKSVSRLAGAPAAEKRPRLDGSYVEDPESVVPPDRNSSTPLSAIPGNVVRRNMVRFIGTPDNSVISHHEKSVDSHNAAVPSM